MTTTTIIRRAAFAVVMTGVLFPSALFAQRCEFTVRLMASQPEVSLEHVDVLGLMPPTSAVTFRGRDISRSEQLRWYQQFYSKIQEHIRENAPDIDLVDRENLDHLMDAEDRRQAIRESERGDGSRVLIPDALIFPEFHVEIRTSRMRETSKAHERMLDDFLRKQGLPLDSRGGQSSTKEVLKRTVTVSCRVRMRNTRTFEILHTFQDTESTDDRTRPGWGGYGEWTEADFESAASVVEQLSEVLAAKYASKLVSMQVPLQIKTRSMCHPCCDTAHKLRPDQYDEAREEAAERYDTARHKHCAAFIVGLTYEAEGNNESAMEWYDRANHHKRLSVYQDAQDRVNEAIRRAERVRDEDTRPGGSGPGPGPTLPLSDTKVVRGPNEACGNGDEVETPVPVVGTQGGRRTRVPANDVPGRRSASKPPFDPHPNKYCDISIPCSLIEKLDKASARRFDTLETPYTKEGMIVEALKEWLDHEERGSTETEPEGK